MVELLDILLLASRRLWGQQEIAVADGGKNQEFFLLRVDPEHDTAVFRLRATYSPTFPGLLPVAFSL
jgi:hypothetical protein